MLSGRLRCRGVDNRRFAVGRQTSISAAAHIAAGCRRSPRPHARYQTRATRHFIGHMIE